MTHQWTGRVVTADGEERIGNSVEIVVSSTLSTITKHPNWTFTEELSRRWVEAVLDSLAVVDSRGTWVGQDAVEGSLFHVALRAGTALETALLECKDRDRGRRE